MNKIFDIFRTPRAASESSGKIPPQALEMEQAVLGALMLEKSAYIRLSDRLKANMFFKEGHRSIYQAVEELFTSGTPIDILTVKNTLSNKGELELAGGLFYLTELTSKVASAANVEHHAQVIAQKWIKRELIKIGDGLISGGYDDTVDVFNLLDALKMESDGLLSGVEVDGGSLMDAVPLVVSDIERAQNGQFRPLTTGFQEMENLVLQLGDLVIVAGRPGMGKTALALALAVEMSVIHGIPVLYSSLEMNEKRLVQRMLASKHNLHTRRLITGDGITQDHVKSFYDYGHAKLRGVFYRRCKTVASLKAAVHRHREKNGLLPTDGLVVMVDYLQLMTGSRADGNREQEIASISRGLKELAEDESCVVVALSQLSRAVEQRGGDREPRLSDLRESGAIEQDADVVLFAYRPEYYGLTVDESGHSLLGVGFLIEAKNRTGIVENGRYKLGFRNGMWVSLSDPVLKEVEPMPDPRRVSPSYSLEDNELKDMPF